MQLNKIKAHLINFSKILIYIFFLYNLIIKAKKLNSCINSHKFSFKFNESYFSEL